MRIRRIRMRNFKCFEEKALELGSRFTLIVGDNGSGKTSILDALAIAAAIWLAKPPDSKLANSRRSILGKEIRIVAAAAGDRVQFTQRRPVVIEAEGEVCGQHVAWRRQIRVDGTRTTNADAQRAIDIISAHYARIRNGESPVSPVLAYYGAGRAWHRARERIVWRGKGGPARRWDAFYDCFEERIRVPDLMNWFQREAVASVSHGGWRPGYAVVRQAILYCIPHAQDLWYDADRDEVVLRIEGQDQPFSNLSAGQQMMLSLVADIAIKAISQNAHLVPDTVDGGGLPLVLQETPGLVLIDELDVHLHPRWQRRVVGDLKDTFPAIQFVCTSHSPFIIQSLDHGELRLLDPAEEGPEYADRPIEDIAEDVQGVTMPQRSARAEEFARATAHYFRLLRTTSGSNNEELSAAEAAYRLAATRYSDNPGLEAVLQLEALARRDASD